ncbi:MAG TPA: glycosyltransferase [Bacteroidota bacterium]|nr:glycosyltransferase [Bacteroidota bacterium]
MYNLLKEMTRSHDVSVIMYGTPAEKSLVTESFGGRLRNIRAVEKPLKSVSIHKRWAQIRSLFEAGSATTWSFYSDAMQHAIDRAVSENAFDLIQREFLVMGLFRAECPGAVHVLDAHNVEYDCVRRMAQASRSPIRRAFYGMEYRKMRQEETEIYGRQDALLVTSSRDKALLDKDLVRTPKFVIPNGVDASYFQPSTESPEPHSLVFTGAMNYFPNADGMTFFIKEILPLIRKHVPRIRVYIVGGRPTGQLVSMASRDVSVTGFVKDVRPYVHRSSVYIVPLRMGGGTRLKVLEALAMGKPVVTTSVGCEGIKVEDRHSALIADSAESFAASVVELLHNDTLRRNLAANGRQLIRAQYEWSAIGERVNEAYNCIVTQNRSPRAPRMLDSGAAMMKS